MVVVNIGSIRGLHVADRLFYLPNKLSNTEVYTYFSICHYQVSPCSRPGVGGDKMLQALSLVDLDKAVSNALKRPEPRPSPAA